MGTTEMAGSVLVTGSILPTVTPMRDDHGMTPAQIR
jgi:hypothetical protein